MPGGVEDFFAEVQRVDRNVAPFPLSSVTRVYGDPLGLEGNHLVCRDVHLEEPVGALLFERLSLLRGSLVDLLVSRLRLLQFSGGLECQIFFCATVKDVEEVVVRASQQESTKQSKILR